MPSTSHNGVHNLQAMVSISRPRPTLSHHPRLTRSASRTRSYMHNLMRSRMHSHLACRVMHLVLRVLDLEHPLAPAWVSEAWDLSNLMPPHNSHLARPQLAFLVLLVLLVPLLWLLNSMETSSQHSTTSRPLLQPVAPIRLTLRQSEAAADHLVVLPAVATRSEEVHQ